jgi:N-acetylmuramoyl-L-alanine amidase
LARISADGQYHRLPLAKFRRARPADLDHRPPLYGHEGCRFAIERLRDPEAKVSCHYLVAEDGQILRMVPEEERAWHAGDSSWRGNHRINSASIGIEIVNPGHELGYRPFPDEQIDALIPLVADIKQRHLITRGNVVGHSDIAPRRKQDPASSSPGASSRGCGSRCRARPRI